MPYQAIIQTRDASPFSHRSEAERFLSQFPVETQRQVIAAMYLGRDNIHEHEKFLEDYEKYVTPDGLSKYCDHIAVEDFPRILADKRESATKYLDKFVILAAGAGLL